MSTHVELVIKDRLSFGGSGPTDYMPVNTWVYDVPDAWIVDGKLSEAGLERIYQSLYGASWRQGNDDGSRYVVVECTVRVLPADDPRPARPVK